MDILNLDKIQIDIPCPKCNYQNKVSFQDIKKQVTIICRGCLREIKLVDKEGSVKQSTKKINSSLNDLHNTIKRISK